MEDGRQPPTQASVTPDSELGYYNVQGWSSCSFGASELRTVTQSYNWNLRGDHPMLTFTSTESPSLYQGRPMKVSLSIIIPGLYLRETLFPYYSEDRRLVYVLVWESSPYTLDTPCIPRPLPTDTNRGWNICNTAYPHTTVISLNYHYSANALLRPRQVR